MSLQSSGIISAGDLRSLFGFSNAVSLSMLYRGGAYVSSLNANVPTSGPIKFSDFYGATVITSNIPSFGVSSRGFNVATGNVRIATGGSYVTGFNAHNIHTITPTTGYIGTSFCYNPVGSNAPQGYGIFGGTSSNVVLSNNFSGNSNFGAVGGNCIQSYVCYNTAGAHQWNVNLVTTSNNNAVSIPHDTTYCNSNNTLVMAGLMNASRMNILKGTSIPYTPSNAISTVLVNRPLYVLGMSASNGDVAFAMRTNGSKIRIAPLPNSQGLLVAVNFTATNNQIHYGLGSNLTAISPPVYSGYAGIGANLYLFKTDPTGTPVAGSYARISGTNICIVCNVRADMDGSMYVCFNALSTFTTVMNTNATSAGYSTSANTSTYFVKFNSSGTFAWGTTISSRTSAGVGSATRVGAFDLTANGNLGFAVPTTGGYGFFTATSWTGTNPSVTADYTTASNNGGMFFGRLNGSTGALSTYAFIGTSNASSSNLPSYGITSVCRGAQNDEFAVSWMVHNFASPNANMTYSIQTSNGARIPVPYYAAATQLAEQFTATFEHGFISYFDDNMNMRWTTRNIPLGGLLQNNLNYMSIAYDPTNRKLLYGGAYASYNTGGISYRDPTNNSNYPIFTDNRYNCIDYAAAYVNASNGSWQ